MKYLLFSLFFIVFTTSFAQELGHVIVRDKETGLLLKEVTVEFKEKKSGKVVTVLSDEKGMVKAELPMNQKFVVTTDMIGYDPIMMDYSTSGKSIVPLDVKIRKTSSDIMVRLDNVLYEYNKYNLSAAGKNQLTILYKFLKENPKFLVEIDSHTDSRGLDAYNMSLSANRSLSCFNYLRSKNLKTGRLIMKNFGETQLLNDCGDGMDCSEDLHQVNRRTEFVLMFPKD
jgi:peptidoglycan-associated lipoprotein